MSMTHHLSNQGTNHLVSQIHYSLHLEVIRLMSQSDLAFASLGAHNYKYFRFIRCENPRSIY
jgi:hypothetical protein